MATTTPRHRISRKELREELREPDEFVSLVDAAGDYIADHLPRVIAAVVGLLVLILLVVGIRLYFSHQSRMAAESFANAGNAYDKKQYPLAAARFAALTADYPGTSLGRLAWLYLGDAYLAQNEAAPARDALQKFLDMDDRPAFRQLALLQQGVAYEAIGNFPDARKVYEQAAAIKESQQGRAELETARLTLRLGDKPGAIALYQRFLREHPFGPERTRVSDALAQLGVAPAIPAVTPKTIELPAR